MNLQTKPTKDFRICVPVSPNKVNSNLLLTDTLIRGKIGAYLWLTPVKYPKSLKCHFLATILTISVI